MEVLVAAILTIPAIASPSVLDPCMGVHAFYYVWYGNPDTNDRWLHWDHEVLPHWVSSVTEYYPMGHFSPPEDPHSPFYPYLGLYSSQSATARRVHFRQMADAGITTAVVSWWGRPDVEGTHDTQGVNSDGFLLELMDDAAAEGIMVSLHMEPYRNRSIHSIKADLEYINTRYADHPAMLWCKLYRSSAGVQQWQHEPSTASRCASASGTRTEHCGPVVYVFDSYHITAKEWGLLLGDSEAPETHADREDSEGAVSSIRGTDLDVVAIGLWLERTSGKDLRAGGFDGGYTYFGAAGFSYGSTPGRWPSMAKEASQLGLLFMPSVAPGYDDSRIRPWNKANVRRRNGGQYYREMWEAALSLPVPPASVGVSTFNEWGEGTQIEPAVPRTVPEGKGIPEEMRRGLGASNTFKDYGDLGPRGYLDITREMAGRLAGLQSKGADGGSVAGGARAEEL